MNQFAVCLNKLTYLVNKWSQGTKLSSLTKVPWTLFLFHPQHVNLTFQTPPSLVPWTLHPPLPWWQNQPNGSFQHTSHTVDPSSTLTVPWSIGSPFNSSQWALRPPLPYQPSQPLHTICSKAPRGPFPPTCAQFSPCVSIMPFHINLVLRTVHRHPPYFSPADPRVALSH